MNSFRQRDYLRSSVTKLISRITEDVRYFKGNGKIVDADERKNYYKIRIYGK